MAKVFIEKSQHIVNPVFTSFQRTDQQLHLIQDDANNPRELLKVEVFNLLQLMYSETQLIKCRPYQMVVGRVHLKCFGETPVDTAAEINEK